jgi:hypothetical protein
VVDLLRRHVPQEAQIVGLDGLFAALVVELAQAAMIVQDESWGLIRQEAIEDLLRRLVVVGELNRSRLALAAKKDGPCLRLYVLMPSEDKSTYGQEKRQIPPERFPMPEEDGRVVKWAERGLAVNAAQGIEVKGKLLVFEECANNERRPRMNVDVCEGRGDGLGRLHALADQNVSGPLSICGLEFRLDEFKVVGVASIPLCQEMGFVLAFQVGFDQAACTLHDATSQSILRPLRAKLFALLVDLSTSCSDQMA